MRVFLICRYGYSKKHFGNRLSWRRFRFRHMEAHAQAPAVPILVLPGHAEPNQNYLRAGATDIIEGEAPEGMLLGCLDIRFRASEGRDKYQDNSHTRTRLP